MKINVRKAGQATIFDLSGTLTFGDPGRETLLDQVKHLIDSGTNCVAVNLSGITYLDSSGVGTLVRIFTLLEKAGGKCIFFAPGKSVLMVLRMVRLDAVFELADDEATALASI